MWFRSTRVVKNGKYKRDPRPDRGNLIYRPDEGIDIRADRLRKEGRSEYVFYSIWSAVSFLVIVLTREIVLLIFLFVGVGGLLGAYIQGLRILRDCPIVEIYEKGVNDRMLICPWEFTYFWPFNEIREIEREDGTIVLRGGTRMTSLSIHKGELGAGGMELIEKGRSGLLGLDTIKEPPELRVYTDGGIIDREGY